MVEGVAGMRESLEQMERQERCQAGLPPRVAMRVQ